MKSNHINIHAQYPKNGFGSYWLHSLKSPYESKFWINIHKGFQLAGAILRDAGIELFFLLVFWLIITKMSQGRDLIVSLFEPDGIYTKWRIFYTVLSAASLSLAMWAIPAFIFQLRDKKNWKKPGYESVFKKHLFFVHRVLPLIPFWLLASVLFNQKGTTLLFIALSLLEIVLLSWFYKKIKSQNTRLLYGAGAVLLLIASILYFRIVHKVEYVQAKIALAIILYLISFLLHLFFHERDREIIKENMKPYRENINSFWRYKVNSLLYTAFFAIQAALIVFFFMDKRLDLAPESMMLFIFSFYVLLIDLVVYIVNFTRRRRFGVFIFLIITVLVYYYSPYVNFNLKHYKLDKNSASSILQGSQRLSFDEKYADLKKKIDSNTTGKPYPIILISGEGGGSRAGLWFSQNIINFDYYTRGKFRQHIFSISTVSGSSVGLSTLFTFWDRSGEKDIDTLWLEFPMNVYSNNFVGSSVKGLLLTDLWKSILPFGSSEKDRNSSLQDEEAYFTQRAVEETLKGKRPEKPIPEAEQILRRDFMDFFYQRSGDSLYFTDRPLVFINSCRSNDGRRGIISPVKLTDDVFNDAVDIAGYLYEDSLCNYKNSKLCYTNKSNISFGQACNLSELFPLFSAPAFIDSLGSFVDGGYHENSGLKTTLDVYLQLKKDLDRDGMKGKYEIYILYFKNGSGKKNLYKGMKSELPFLLPIKALSSQPFEGSASYFEEKARFVEDTAFKTSFLSIQLDNQLIKDTSTSFATEKEKRYRKIEEEILQDLRTEKDINMLSFPLARWLSKSVIKRIRIATFPVKERPQGDDVRMVGLLEKINAFHGIKAASNDPFYKWTPNARRLMLEQKKVKMMTAD